MTSQTVVTAAGSALPVELPEAKAHLRIISEDLDTEVQAALEAAIDYCETMTGRSLRESLTVQQTYGNWPCEPIQFNRQPVKSITSITYWDDDGASQTVSTADYRLYKSTNAAAYLGFDTEFAKPLLYYRDDAITITYVAGYESIAAVPPRAKHAIKMMLTAFFGDVDEREMDKAEKCADRLLASIDWGSYR